MQTIQEMIHAVSLQLEQDTDMLNGYRSKVADLHKKIRNHASIIAHNVSPLHLAYHAARIAEYSALLEEYNAEIEMLEKSIEIANSDLENLESEVE